MIILVTGSRNYNNYEIIKEYVKKHFNKNNDVVIHGGAKGVDSLMERACKEEGIYTKVFRPVNPSIPAYYLHRNAEMVGLADRVVAFWDGVSRGTKFTIDYAKARGKDVKMIKGDIE